MKGYVSDSNCAAAVRVLLVFVGTCHLYGNAIRHTELVAEGLTQFYTIGEGIAISKHSADGDDTLTILTLDGWRNGALRHFGDVANAHVLTLSIRNNHVLDILDRTACCRFITHLDVVLFTVLTIAAHN